MSTTLQVRSILLTLVIMGAALLVTMIFYAQEQIRQATDIITQERIITLSQVSSRTELRIGDAIKILQIASKNDHIAGSTFASSINNELHGIPENFDTDKRKAMRDVFEVYGDFQNILFVLPNGDAYVAEPFFFQKNSTVSNFAFRDWYKDVIATHEPVVSQVIISKLSGTPIVTVAVPVFSQNGSLKGILRGSLNLDKIQQRLEDLKSYSNERILIVDGAGTVVADSTGATRGQKSPIVTESIQKALAGKLGTTTETVNNTKTFTGYYPIKIGQTRWALISIQPYDEAFRSVNATIQESYIVAILIILIISISIYYLNKSFQSSVKLTIDLEKANEFLKKSQGIIIEAEEKFRNLFNLSPDAILVFDTNGIITSHNESFKDLFGHSKEELIGKSVFVLVKDDKLDLAHSYFDEILKTGFIKNKENWLKRKDGTVFPSLFSVSSLTDKNNSVIGYVSIIKDITEIHDIRKRLQEANETITEQLERLVEVDRLKEEFVTMITHELKTPLVTMSGYAQMLKEVGLLGILNGEQITAVDQIAMSVDKLEKLISDIFDAQKLDLKKMKFNKVKFNVDEFMNDIVKENSFLMNDKKIKFVNSTKEKLVITSDKDRLSQVFANLIKNAVDFVSENNGSIKIHAQSNDSQVVFYVKDNGIGIPKEKQENLFKKFYQIDTSLKRKHGGTGLGLVICKGVVEGLGGKIWLESEVRKGTTVFFTIPKNDLENHDN